jgi:hypothetical protein
LRRLRLARDKQIHKTRPINQRLENREEKSNKRKREKIITERYSQSIITEKKREEYSVIKPATSSDSASGKSKGTRLHSTRIHNMKIKKRNKEKRRGGE